MISLEDINDARSRFEGRVTETPLVRSNSFSRLSRRDVYLKAECMQRTGSFKIRGALNVLTRLEGKPVVAASAGNHAQGVALAARFAGSPCTVFMPKTAPIPKIKATQDYGATVKLKGNVLADAVEAAQDYTAKTGDRFVHPYDDPLIVAGQATLGLEIAEQLPDVGTVVVPTGGGGLLAGTALALHQVKPDVKVIGVEIEPAAVYADSREQGSLITDYPRGRATVADGINVSVASKLVWDILDDHVDEILVAHQHHVLFGFVADDLLQLLDGDASDHVILVVDDNQTTAAMTMILDRSRLLVEPAGAVGVAALLEGLLPDDTVDPVCIVLSGGNVDLLFLGKAVRHGLEASGRFARFTVHVPDQPGSLAKILKLVANEGGNVVQIDHHREGFGLPFGRVEIEIAVETKDAEHAAQIAAALGKYLA